MNCKPGDLAIVVGTRPRSNGRGLGRIVRVLRASDDEPNEWVVEFRGESNWYAYDRNLRPIRDNDGEDETLSWNVLQVHA